MGQSHCQPCVAHCLRDFFGIGLQRLKCRLGGFEKWIVEGGGVEFVEGVGVWSGLPGQGGVPSGSVVVLGCEVFDDVVGDGAGVVGGGVCELVGGVGDGVVGVEAVGCCVRSTGNTPRSRCRR